MSHTYDPNARYAKSDEWARVEGDLVVVGISDYAQDQLSDVVYVELPAVGKPIKAGQAVAVVESVKAASDIYAPISGVVVATNDELGDTPELVNADAFGAAWFFKVQATDLGELDALMSADEYAAYNETREH